MTLTSLEEITFELAREGLREQAHDVDTLGSRAGTLLAVAIAAAGLLAEPATRDVGGLPLLLAIAGFAAAGRSDRCTVKSAMGRNEPYRAPKRSSVIPEPYPVQWVTETRGLNDIDRELLALQEGRELPDDSWRGRMKRLAARITRRTAA